MHRLLISAQCGLMVMHNVRARLGARLEQGVERKAGTVELARQRCSWDLVKRSEQAFIAARGSIPQLRWAILQACMANPTSGKHLPITHKPLGNTSQARTPASSTS